MRLDPNRMHSGMVGDGELRVHAARRKQATYHLTSRPFFADETVLMVIESVSTDHGELAAPVPDIPGGLNPLRPRLVFRFPAVLVECARLAIGNHASTLLDECTDLAFFRGRERAGTRQNQDTITTLQQLALLHLPITHKAVLKPQIFDQAAP